MLSVKSILAITAGLAAVAVVKAQDDVILWHNRYHAVLAMAGLLLLLQFHGYIR